MDTNSQVERKKQKIAGSGAQKKTCAFLRVLAQNLGFLVCKILAFLRVLARCFRVVKPEIMWYFLVCTYWGQESEFQRRTNRVAVGFEFLQKKATKITTWPLNLEWQGQLKAERSRCQRVNTWKNAVEFKTKTLGIEKTKRLVAKRDRPLLSSADGSKSQFLPSSD